MATDENDAADIRQIVAGIKNARKRKRLTQRELADRMRTTQSAVSELESAAVEGSDAPEPRLKTLQRAARAVGLLVQVEVSPGPDHETWEALWRRDNATPLEFPFRVALQDERAVAEARAETASLRSL